jgi:hypothetical protein
MAVTALVVFTTQLVNTEAQCSLTWWPLDSSEGSRECLSDRLLQSDAQWNFNTWYFGSSLWTAYNLRHLVVWFPVRVQYSKRIAASLWSVGHAPELAFCLQSDQFPIWTNLAGTCTESGLARIRNKGFMEQQGQQGGWWRQHGTRGHRRGTWRSG